MADQPSVRLNKVLRELNISLDRAVEFLNQKGIEVIFSSIKNANHFFQDKEGLLKLEIEKYIKEKTALI